MKLSKYKKRASSVTATILDQSSSSSSVSDIEECEEAHDTLKHQSDY